MGSRESVLKMRYTKDMFAVDETDPLEKEILMMQRVVG